MSIIQRASLDFFGRAHGQPDVLNMQMQFPRMLYPGDATLSFKEIHTGRGASTIHVTVQQDDDICALGYVNLTDLSPTKGLTLETNWQLDPKPIPVSIPKLSADEDPCWVSILTPYHSESWRRVQSYVKFHVPFEMQDKSIRDHWIRHSDLKTKWTNETLGFVIDICYPMLDNFFPENSIGNHDACVAEGLKQSNERENGTTVDIKDLDESSGLYDTPATYMSLNISFDVHKKLPVGGVDWLFLRGRARQINSGRLSLEVTVLDEGGELVALGSHLCQIIDLRRASKTKAML